jgi:uncharacterized protein (TIGR03435 family)
MTSFISELLQLALSGSAAGSLLLKVTLTATLALGAMSLTRRTRAAARHAVLAASFALFLLLPLASLVAPTVRVVVPVQVRQAILESTLPKENAAPATAAAVEKTFTRVSSAAQSSRLSISVVLFSLWLLGAMISLVPVAAGLWQAHALRRSAVSWREGKAIARKVASESGIDRNIDILLHDAVPSPMTSGTIRPMIVLPLDAQTWSGEELDRALTHELEHVRRADWFTRCLARVICAAYWFHPLVWVTWRQFVLEAERACDDAVLRRGEATAYADQLVVLAQRLLKESNQPILAMANRYDLAKRVSALLDSRQRRGRAGVAWVVLACITSALLVTAISPLYLTARIQTPTPTNTQKFDVAIVKPCNDADFRNGNERRLETSFSPGRITVNCLPLHRIIYLAYTAIGSLDNPLMNASQGDPSNLRGGPGWLRDETYYIEGRAEGTPERQVMLGAMLRALLEDRFNLQTHRELMEEAMYALTVAKGGLKIKPIGPDGCVSFDPARTLSAEERMAANRGDTPVCGNFRSLGNSWQREIALAGITMDRFANQTLSSILDRHVTDKTGVEGRFNIKLQFSFDDSIRQGVFGGRPVGAVQEPPPGESAAPVIVTALEEQLGLKLAPTRGAHGFVMIDSVERLRQ